MPRTAAFVALAAFILLGPAWVQLGPGELKWFRSWQMYSGSGVGTCDVHFVRRTPKGREVPVDHVAVLHKRTTWTSTARQRRITDKSLMGTAKRLCRQMRAKDIRADARCATREGWEVKLTPDVNLCSPGLP
jgi:hypothetical protein